MVSVYVIHSNYCIYFTLVIFLSLSCEWVIIALHHCYICVCINIFVNVISMLTEIFWCTSYDLLLGCDTSWESGHVYVLCIICYTIVVILVEFHSQKCINISLFELVVTSIETHIFVPSFSISHILCLL